MESVIDSQIPVVVPAQESPRSPVGDDRGGRFIVFSVLAHVALFTFALWLPQNATAASAPEREIEIAFLAEPKPETKKVILPKGTLDESLPSATTKAKAPLRVAKVAAPKSPARTAAPPEEPKTLTASSRNPYASGNFAMFSRGSSSAGNSATHRVAASTKNYGVESGSAGASADAEKALRAWQGKIRALLNQRAQSNYPVRARKLGHQGQVRLSLTIEANGTISSARAASGSGSPLLDRAALSAAKGAMPPPPHGTRSHVVVPVVYRLK